MKSCATSNLKKASLELGGKSPLIIFGDFDLDRAVKIAMGSVFFNKGENCIAAGRIFVEETIYDEFLQKVVDETKKMKIGDPLDRSTAHGPQNHRAHLQKLVEYCQTGVEQGEYVKNFLKGCLLWIFWYSTISGQNSEIGLCCPAIELFHCRLFSMEND